MILNTDGGDISVFFGNGDIIVSHIKSIGEDNEKVGIRLNWSKKTYNVGDNAYVDNIFEDNDDVYAHPAVNLIFTKKESIDVVIGKLEEMKKFFNEKEDENSGV